MTRIDYDGISEERFRSVTIIRSNQCAVGRRIFYLNSYGMAGAWRDTKKGTYPGQHLWGCIELARAGYEVAMPEESDRNARFFNYRRQDLKHIAFAKSWLGREGILYSGHTVLFWAPFLAQLRLIRCPIVTMLYARGENLRFARGYDGILALTPPALERAEQLTPSAKRAHIGWGVDFPFFPELPYNPQWFLCCGKTRRDFVALKDAAISHPGPIHIVNAEQNTKDWPSNVRVAKPKGGASWETVSYHDLIMDEYAGCAAALILLQEDNSQRYAAGFTQLLEAMALARPVIVTRTGALAAEIDVEKEGCGLFIPPGDARSLAAAMKRIADDPCAAKSMGQNGRRLCETRYNIKRYGRDLQTFFDSL
jgi:hypothetical protein